MTLFVVWHSLGTSFGGGHNIIRPVTGYHEVLKAIEEATKSYQEPLRIIEKAINSSKELSRAIKTYQEL